MLHGSDLIFQRWAQHCRLQYPFAPHLSEKRPSCNEIPAPLNEFIGYLTQPTYLSHLVCIDSDAFPEIFFSQIDWPSPVHLSFNIRLRMCFANGLSDAVGLVTGFCFQAGASAREEPTWLHRCVSLAMNRVLPCISCRTFRSILHNVLNVCFWIVFRTVVVQRAVGRQFRSLAFQHCSSSCGTGDRSVPQASSLSSEPHTLNFTGLSATRNRHPLSCYFQERVITIPYSCPSGRHPHDNPGLICHHAKPLQYHGLCPQGGTQHPVTDFITVSWYLLWW